MAEHALERWRDAHAPDSSLVAAPFSGRVVHLLVDGTAHVDASVEGLRQALAAARGVKVLVLGGGGRSRIGTLLTRRALVARELGQDVPVRWVELDRDRPIQRWAAALGVEVG